MDSSKILTRLRTGKEEELAILFSELRSSIQAMILARLDRRLLSRVDASDVLQEAFIRASQGLDRFLDAPTVHPVVWIRQIGKHLVVEMHRRHFRHKRSPDVEVSFDFDLSNRLVDQLAASMTSVCTNLARREALERVRNLLTELSPHDREVLEMRHTDGMTIREIASMLELNPEAVKKRYQRALNRLIAAADAEPQSVPQAT